MTSFKQLIECSCINTVNRPIPGNTKNLFYLKNWFDDDTDDNSPALVDKRIDKTIILTLRSIR